MRNRPILDGKITNKKEFLENMLLDWEDAKKLYDNWEEISKNPKRDENDTLDLALAKDIFS